MSWTIGIADAIHESGRRWLEDRGARVLVEDAALKDPAQLDALIVRSRTKVTRDLLSRMPNLKVVGRAGVGVDNIDLEAARARGVIVVNAPQATTEAVAEHTIALLFAVARSIPQADATMKQGRWEKKRFMGIELAGRTLGLIGLGRIGAAVARRARGLGMQVVAYDPYLRPEAIRERGAEPMASLEDLYARADVVSVHVPLTKETRHLIDQEAFARMKDGVILLCTARGGVVDEEALLQALESGRVYAAGLDVFAQEPPGATPLVTHPRVVATPHIAAQTREAQARVALDIVQEVWAALTGGELRWRVV